MAIETESVRATSVSATIRSRNAPSDAAARDGNARSSRPRTSRAHSELADKVGWRPAASSGRSSWVAGDLLDAFHHPFADAARRHVDDTPQAHIVVRVDDEPHVGQRVLDFLPLVEADAADDL